VRRILSIDGGGIKGTFPASFLSQIESALALRSVADYFDLIAGTSAGGIIALGLGLGLTAREMTDFFVKQGSEIFPPSRMKRNFRFWAGKERYTPDNLRRILESVFGERTLAESKSRLLIPSFDTNRGDIYIYKTAHNERLGMDYRMTAVEVALATSAAPTYFRSHVTADCVALVDGGIWANNPVALAVVEGIGVLGWKGDEMAVLSLGCSEEATDFNQRGHSASFWIRRCLSATMRGQSRSALGIARHLTGRDRGLENVFRFDPSVAADRFSLDDVAGVRELEGIGYSEARQALPSLKKQFFASTADPFVSMK
jgi:patatin-like phospholipase/acyl hydrolase